MQFWSSHSSLDAAFGVTGLAVLYILKWSLAYFSQRYPRFARLFFFMSSLRHALVIIVSTIISWRVNIHLSKPVIALVGTVPSGLQHVGAPYVSTELLAAIGPQIFVATIILLLEHISIAKSFGRINGYKINPNQELIAIGVNNTLGTLFSAYPSTGSFSRSALKSKAGVRTPAAGIPTGIVVLIALYAVAPAFYWIPNASIAAIIIHAVADLVASPKQSYAFWRVSPLEYFIFVGAVLWSVFYTIESGIYWSLASSVVLLLFRIARPKGHFLGRIHINGGSNLHDGEIGQREVYVPLEDDGITNRELDIDAPPPGIVIYRFEESFLYPNASYINDRLVDHVKSTTRRGREPPRRKGDRAWNDARKQLSPDDQAIEDRKPLLRAVILDFGGVANIDTTGVQNLIDTRKEVEKWADRTIPFHFCGIRSPWIRRALIAGGFGRKVQRSHPAVEVAPVVVVGSPVLASTRIDTPAQSGASSKATSLLEEGLASPATLVDHSPERPERGLPGPAVRSITTSLNATSLLDSATPLVRFECALPLPHSLTYSSTLILLTHCMRSSRPVTQCEALFSHTRTSFTTVVPEVPCVFSIKGCL